MIQNILVLCVGNICRSPIAKAMLARELPGRTVTSAGLEAAVGMRADPMAVELASLQRMDLSSHRARQVSGRMCRDADLILVMEQSHKGELAQRYPTVQGKVFRLGEMDDLDIADPYRRPRSAFEAACTGIARGVGAWAARIRRLDEAAASREPRS